MEVAIIGGGATGLIQAVLLQKRGIKVSVFEKNAERPTFTRVVGLDPSTMHTLENIGIVEEVIQIGKKINKVKMFHNSKQIANLSLDHIDIDFPFILATPLSEFEGLLETKIECINRGVSLENIQNKSGKKLAAFSDGSNREFDLIIAADGAKSHVRELSSIGSKWEPYKFSLEMTVQLADNQLDAPELHFTKGRMCGFILPCTSQVVQVIRGVDPNVPSIDLEVKGEVISQATIPIERRIADTFYENGILLLGDAAHHMSPFGGRGLNLAIEDARLYAWAISKGEIEEIAKARRKKAKSVISETHQITKNAAYGSWKVIVLFKLFNTFPKLFNKLLQMHANVTKGKR